MNNFYKRANFSPITESLNSGVLLLLFSFTFFQQALSAQPFSATNQVILSNLHTMKGDSGRGFAFTPNVTTYVTEIGLRVPSSLDNSYEFVIWERGTSTKIHQQAITISTFGTYEYFPVTAPITLSSGVEYMSSYYGKSNAGEYRGTDNGQINANLTYHQALRCNDCSANTMPTIYDFGEISGAPDFMFQLTDPSATASIPTLSEWGLIILALMLMTAGTLYLVQPNWRGSFEQELEGKF